MTSQSSECVPISYTSSSSTVEMPVYGSAPRKDHELLVEPDRGRRSSLLPLYGACLGIALLIIFTTASFFAYTTWKTKRDTASNVVIIDDSNFDILNVKVDGRVVVQTINEVVPNPQCFAVNDADKFDCYPEPDASEDQCVKRGCCWKSANGEKSVSGTPPLGVPYCYFPSSYQGYELIHSKESDDGIRAIFKRKFPSGIPKEVQLVQVDVIPIDATRLRIKITDAVNTRYETPYPIINVVPRGKTSDRKYDVTLSDNGQLTITRKSSKVKIIDTRLSSMFYADQLLQLNIKVPFHGFYGLGEHQDGLLRGVDWKRYSLLNRDRSPMKDANLYGAHPIYFQMEDDSKNTHAVVLRNSNIMEIITQPTPGITFRPIGGIFDFYVLLGDNPADVVQQYQGLVGHPIMPPYWSLGFHLCKYGYGSLEKTKAAYQRTKDAGIPFDVQWNDIDYMDRYNDFTYDKKAFDGLPEFVDQLHQEGMRYVMIMDVGVSGAEKPGTYPPFDDGVDQDIFIKNNTGDILYAKVWNTVNTVFPDFTHPRANEYQALQYENFYKDIKFDGSWIDMNEPSNFFEGSIDGCPRDSELDHPYYVPLGIGEERVLAAKTVCMSALHHATTHYNLHNIHGMSNGIATNYALKTVLKKRPFIISRSTFLGQGYYTGHWSGDIYSTWEHLKYTIPVTLNFAMYGFSMMGSDICGFVGNTTVELCARWQSLGAFYPFSRNHNTIDTMDQDPAALGPIVVNATRNSLLIRYRLLPFLYTLFYRSTVYAETLFRPLFFEFPEDKNTHAIDTTFLWGSSFLIIPILDEKTTKVTTYIPSDVWYNYYDGVRLLESGNVTLSAQIDEINLLIRGGHILPAQAPALTTTESRKNNFQLIVALKDGKASGELYWDDGETLDTYEHKEFNLINFEAKDKKLTSTVIQNGYNATMPLDYFEIFGVTDKPTTVTVNGNSVAFDYNSVSKVIKTKTKFAPVDLLQNINITWI